MACYASKVISIAAAEIGYKEKKSNSQLDDKTANAGSKNYTKYARDFDEKYPNWYNYKKQTVAWCDMFVDWCFLKAFGYDKALSLLCQPEKSAGAGCTYSSGYYRAKGQFYTKDPKPGDQIFFGNSLSDVYHTGIVEKADKSKVYTIEGNSSDQVERCSYSLTYSKIVGYGRPKFDAEPAKTEKAEKTETPTTTPNTGSKKTVDELAQEVMDRKWGDNPERRERLIAAGYDYDAVQAKVNELIDKQKKKAWTPKVGDIVIYKGTTHYASANATKGYTCTGGQAKITKIYNLGTAKHPYHLVRVLGKGASVYGWVNAGSFTKA